MILNFENDKLGVTSLGFVALIIKGTLGEDRVPSGFGNGSVSKNARKFEIQIVSPDNENETGRNHHSVYDVVKLVGARVRLGVGGCSERDFNKYVSDAIADTKESRKKILSYLLEPYEDQESVIFKKGSKYFARNIYSRLEKFGWVETLSLI